MGRYTESEITEVFLRWLTETRNWEPSEHDFKIMIDAFKAGANWAIGYEP